MCVCVCERQRERETEGDGGGGAGKFELSTEIKPPGREGKKTTELREGLSTHSPCFCVLAELEAAIYRK